jgi:hypothetical protein
MMQRLHGEEYPQHQTSAGRTESVHRSAKKGFIAPKKTRRGFRGFDGYIAMEQSVESAESASCLFFGATTTTSRSRRPIDESRIKELQ